MVGLFDLPVELRQCIVNFITKKTDMKALCLTCHHLRILTLPQLYHKVELAPSDLKRALSCFMLSCSVRSHFSGKENSSSWVQQLIITDSKHDWREDDQYADLHPYRNPHWQIEAYTQLSDLLAILPQHQLSLFEYHTTRDVPKMISSLLQCLQRRLTNFQLHHHHDVPVDTSILEHVTAVSLFLKTYDDCQSARQILAHCPRATKLSILASDDWEPDPEEYDYEETCRDIVDTIFGGPDAQGVSHRLQIRSLEMQHIWFDEQMASMMCECLDLAGLDELIMLECWQGYFFVRQLGQGKASPRSVVLHSPHFFRDWSDSLAGLRKLKVFYIGEDGWFDFWNGVKAHGSSLCSLSIGVDQDSFEIPNQKEKWKSFHDACESCTLLEQLSFVVPIYSDPVKTNESIQTLTTTLALLSKLQLLKLTVYNMNAELPLDSYRHVAEKQHTATDWAKFAAAEWEREELARNKRMRRAQKENPQRVADLVFAALRESCPRLRAVVVNYWDTDGDRSRSRSYQGFLRELHTDDCGGTTTEAVPVAPHLIKHHVSEADILELPFIHNEDSRWVRTT